MSVPNVAAEFRMPYVAVARLANTTLPDKGAMPSAPVSAVPTDVSVAIAEPFTAGAVADVAFPATVNVPLEELLAP